MSDLHLVIIYEKLLTYLKMDLAARFITEVTKVMSFLLARATIHKDAKLDVTIIKNNEHFVNV